MRPLLVPSPRKGYSLSFARKQIPVNHSALRGMRMPLIDPLPKPLEEKLAPVIESKDVAAAVFTDLDPCGRFGEEWLILTPTSLSVYVSNGNGFAPRVYLMLQELKRSTLVPYATCCA